MEKSMLEATETQSVLQWKGLNKAFFVKMTESKSNLNPTENQFLCFLLYQH